MALDPQLQPLIEAMLARANPPFWTLPTVAEARLEADGGLLALLDGLGFDHLAGTRDLCIPGVAAAISARAYLPAEPAGRALMVYFHGGGGVVHSIATHDLLCRTLCHRSRCAVVSVDYRLAPEHPFPAAIEDAWSALTWVQDHAAEFDADPARIGVAGDSAGGTLAAVVALLNRDDSRPRLGLQLLLYPRVDARGGYPSLVTHRKRLLTTDLIEWFDRCYAPEGVHRSEWRLSPICAPSHAGVAPACIVTAEYDPLRDEGEAYARVLEAAGVPTILRRYQGQVHGFLQFTSEVDAAGGAMEQIGAMTRTALLND